MSEEREIVVSKNKLSKFRSINDAIKKAVNGTKITVEPGVYNENIFIDKDVEINGNGSTNEVIIRSNESTTIIMKAKQAVIKGITIQQEGTSQKNENYFAVDVPVGTLTLKNCGISSNRRHGVRVHNLNTKSIMKNCQVFNCNGVGIFVTNEGNLEMDNCEVFGNNENGLLFQNADGKVEECEIYSNSYSNVLVENESAPQINNCKIYNSKQNGIVIKENSRGTIVNCEIYSNLSSNIGISTRANPKIRGCKSFSSKQGGIIVADDGRGIIESCEIYSNRLTNVEVKGKSTPLIQDCKIYNSEQAGVWINQGSQGTIENCEIYKNAFTNVLIENESILSLRNSKIFESAQHGVLVQEKGKIILEENCEISGNAKQDIVVSDNSIFENINSITNQDTKNNIIDSEKKESLCSDLENTPQSYTELDKVLEELNSLIGMENVKREIQKRIEYIQFNKDLEGFGIKPDNIESTISHTVLYGNPGTGKTTVAKLLGKLYKAMGLLPSDHVVQVNREKLVGEYIGHTAPKTKSKIEEAIGGILFIDEAYSLTNKGSKNDFGTEAIEILLEEMENRKGEFMVVVAGYEKEMKNFLEANPGLQSRFTQYFHLQDYTPDEMLEIACKMFGDKQRQVSQEAMDLLYKHFTDLWRKRDQYFSNARTVRNYVEKILQEQAQRCMKVSKEQWTKEFLLVITVEDVRSILSIENKKTFDIPIDEELLSEALKQLNRNIGMDKVKKEIEKLITLVRYYKEEGKNLKDLSAHIILTGNPGTGKTETARIISKIYQALGILEHGDLIEVNRDKLVSAYSGESEKLIANYIEQSIGGTLFIDEAYQLTQYGTHDPGHKVIEVLLKYMEDRRGEFVVIVAGYHNKMEEFLNSNYGLRRRFTQQLQFDDYTPSELMEISIQLLQESGYQINDEAQEKLFSYYQSKYNNRDQTFGNAGFARNMVGELIKSLDFRMAKLPKEKRKQINTKAITPLDINTIVR